MNDSISYIEFSKFTKDLWAQVDAVYKKRGQQISLTSEIKEMFFDIDTAVPLGLMLNELFTNSCKYAFNQSDGTIAIRIEKTSEGFSLFYHDSGPGLPKGMKLENLKGMGTMILKSLSKQIGGIFSYLAENQTFIITFKDNAELKQNALI